MGRVTIVGWDVRQRRQPRSLCRSAFVAERAFSSQTKKFGTADSAHSRDSRERNPPRWFNEGWRGCDSGVYIYQLIATDEHGIPQVARKTMLILG
jgi:hypothetical protein